MKRQFKTMAITLFLLVFSAQAWAKSSTEPLNQSLKQAMTNVKKGYNKFSNKAQHSFFCRIEPVLSHNGFRVPYSVIQHSMQLMRASLAAAYTVDKVYQEWAEIFEDQKNTKEMVVKTLSIWKPAKAFTKSLVPFWDKTANAAIYSVNKFKQNERIMKAKGLATSGQKKPSKVELAYANFMRIRNFWWPICLGITAIRVTSLAVCKEASMFFTTICLKKKQACTEGESDAPYVFADDESAEELKRQGYSCTSDAQNATTFRNLSSSYRTKGQTINSAILEVTEIVEKQRATLEKMNKKLKPIAKKLEKIKKTMNKLNKGLKPIFKAMKLLKKALSKKVCIKVKIGGKKIKKCGRVDKTLKKLNKMAKQLQKPFEKAIKPILNPIFKEIKKQISKVKYPDITKIFKKLEKPMKTMENFHNKIKKFKNNPFTSYNNQLLQLKNALKTLNGSAT